MHILAWVRNLDSETFAVREKATAELKKRLDTVVPLLEAELARSPSPEARRRARALRVLDYIAEREKVR